MSGAPSGGVVNAADRMSQALWPLDRPPSRPAGPKLLVDPGDRVVDVVHGLGLHGRGHEHRDPNHVGPAPDQEQGVRGVPERVTIYSPDRRLELLPQATTVPEARQTDDDLRDSYRVGGHTPD